jgi:hypothetical protein
MPIVVVPVFLSDTLIRRSPVTSSNVNSCVISRSPSFETKVARPGAAEERTYCAGRRLA